MRLSIKKLIKKYTTLNVWKIKIFRKVIFLQDLLLLRKEFVSEKNYL